MPLIMDGDFEIVDFEGNSTIRLYDNAKIEQYPPHWHNTIEIIMPVKNSFKVICDGKDYFLKERDIIIIPAGTLHILNAQEGRRIILLINNETICGNPALTGLSAFLNCPIHISGEKNLDLLEKLNLIFKEIYIAYNSFNADVELYIYTKFLTMMHEIISDNFFQRKLGEKEIYADKFETIIKFIEKNYMNEISLDSLVKISGYSKFYFSRMFSKHTGTTLPDFLNRRRIMAAEMLLLDHKKNITDIAMQSGFSSLSTFNRVFKKTKGCTPTEFRKFHSP